MSTTIPTKIEKCKGAMVASAIGDALGWPNEPCSKNRAKKPKTADHFVEWTRSCKYPRYHDEIILPGEYSDDTQMTLSVARSIIAGDWERFLTEKEIPFWLNYERGGGGALLKASRSLSEKKISPWQSNYTRDYFNAGGNGATMRILPHVIAMSKTPDITVLMQDIIKDTLITHGHPRAFLGATCYAYALNYLMTKETVLEYGELVNILIDGQEEWAANINSELFGNWLNVANQHQDYDFFTEWNNTCIRMLQQLEFIKSSLKKGLMLDDTKVLTELECFGKANGAGDVAALAAIYLASRYANSPVLGIKVPAFSFGSDTDTIASITGGLLGMLSGTSWIPVEWKSVQDYDCLIQITELLLADNRKEATKVEVAEAKAQDNDWVTTQIGKMRLVDTKNATNGKNGIVIIKKWQTVLGQTLYTKTFQPNNEQAQIPQQPSLYEMAERPANKIESQPQTHNATSIPIEREEKIPSQKSQNQFVLNSTSIVALLDNPKFKTSMTVGKMMKIINLLLEGNETNDTIAKRLNADHTMVDLIKKCIIEGQ